VGQIIVMLLWSEIMGNHCRHNGTDRSVKVGHEIINYRPCGMRKDVGLSQLPPTLVLEENILIL